MKKKRLYKDVIFLLASFLITAVVWVGFEIYRAYVKSETPEGVEKYLEGLDPKLDPGILLKLETKII
jgi:hypothetical protein